MISHKHAVMTLERRGATMLVNFPLLLISLAIYNFVIFFDPTASWTDQMFSVHMQSGVAWVVSRGDGLIATSLSSAALTSAKLLSSLV
jgi:hypothetical protein